MTSHQSVHHTPGLPGQTAVQPKGAVVYCCVCVPPLSVAAVLLLSQTPSAPQSALPVICRVHRVRERVKTQQAVPREELTPAEQDAHSAQVVRLPPCSLTHVDEPHTHTHVHTYTLTQANKLHSGRAFKMPLNSSDMVLQVYE